MYLWVADVVLVVHALFVVFVVVGQLAFMLGAWRGWCWTRRPGLRGVHLGATAFVTGEAWLGLPCPLTVLEQWLRRLAGTGAYEGSFIGHWLGGLLFYQAPGWLFTALYTAFLVLVAATWWLHPPRHRVV